MDAQPTLQESIKAHWDVVPGLVFLCLLSLAIAFVRFVWVTANGGSPLEATGLFSPWFAPWVVGIVVSLRLDAETPVIEARAHTLRCERQRAQYGEAH